MELDEEVDEYAGLNVWQKYLKWYRKQYAKMAAWRKKAARVKYWLGIVKKVQSKAGKFVGIGIGFLAIGGAQYASLSRMWKAEEEKAVVVEANEMAVRESKDSKEITRDLQEKLRQCGCADATGADVGVLAAADAVLDRFGGDKTLNPEASVILPDKTSASIASLIGGHYNSANKNRTNIPKTINRVCSASADKERMTLVAQQVARYGLPEAYAFVPFVESYWCELAVSHTGPRGMMQFTRKTAVAAWNKTDSSQSDIPPYDFKAHRDWLVNYSQSRGYRGYYGLLATCSASDRLAYQNHFYPGERNAKYPKRIDPRDARTDWEASTEAAFSWLDYLNTQYKSRGFKDFTAMMLAMSAYNQGEGEVMRWIQAARARYKVENMANLSFPQVIGGAMELLQKEGNAEKARQIAEGMRYAPSIVGVYLAVAPQLDEKNCR